MQPPFYTPSFTQHLHSLAISGFYGRYIDADDLEFLEYVRKTGSANSSLPNTSAVLIEELEFWHLPYSLAPGIERHVGKRQAKAEPVDSLRKARSEAFRARRVIREQENKIAETELERERRIWKEADLKRRQRMAVSDAEWEANAPGRVKIGAVVERHYVPQWKLDEIRDAKTSKKARKALNASIPNLAKQARQEKAQERARLLLEVKQDQDRLQAERVIAEARRVVERAEEMERIRKSREVLTSTREQTFPTVYTVDTLKVAVTNLLRRTLGVAWTGHSVMRALGCTDQDMMDRCLLELEQERRLQLR
jgi:hypothetical protein